MAFTPDDKKMLEGYIQKARPFEEMFSVKGKTALVTGGTSGLGFMDNPKRDLHESELTFCAKDLLFASHRPRFWKSLFHACRKRADFDVCDSYPTRQ